MADFAKIFIQDTTLESCFVCKNSSYQIQESNMIDEIKKKRQRFFDFDKVLKDLETKEMRK